MREMQTVCSLSLQVVITPYTLFICIFYCLQYFREITDNVKRKYSLYQTFRSF